MLNAFIFISCFLGLKLCFIFVFMDLFLSIFDLYVCKERNFKFSSMNERIFSFCVFFNHKSFKWKSIKDKR